MRKEKGGKRGKKKMDERQEEREKEGGEVEERIQERTEQRTEEGTSLQVSSQVYKFLHTGLPKYFGNLVVLPKFHPPTQRLSNSVVIVLLLMHPLFGAFPDETRVSPLPSIASFTKQLKTYLHTKAYPVLSLISSPSILCGV